MAAFKQTSRHLPKASFLQEINIHHNYAAQEKHHGEDFIIHRKGATSAKERTGIIRGSMEPQAIVRGLGNPESFNSCSHGAGRRMGRMEANRTLTMEECDAAMEGIAFDRWSKYKGFGKRQKGQMDFSEAPQAYKLIDEVMAAQDDLVEPIVRLTPLAVLKG